MSKKYSLVLTDSFEKLERTENILTLKPQIPNFGRDIKFETVSFPEISKKEIYDRYNFCEKIFDSLLRDLAIELNSIHKIDYSQRSWDIIIDQDLIREAQQKEDKIKREKELKKALVSVNSVIESF